MEEPILASSGEWDKVRVVGAQEFYNHLVSLQYAVVDLRDRDEWKKGPRLDMAQPYWPHRLGKDPREEAPAKWEDEFGFENRERVLLYDAVGAGLSPRSKSCSDTIAVPPALSSRVRRFSEDDEVHEVLLLDGGIQAFIDRYAFLAADGQALHPELGSHFYPSHIWDLPVNKSECTKAIYLSSKMASRDRKVLDDLNIRYIINATREVDNEFEDANDDHFSYHRCVVADSESADISAFFEGCWAFIDEAFQQGSSVLVHCAQGVSRSPTIVVSYLVGMQGWRLDTAYSHVRQMREKVQINRGFYRQLHLLDSRLHDTDRPCK